MYASPMEDHWKFQEKGGSKARLFKGKYEGKLEFPEGLRGVKPKNLPWGIRYGYFLPGTTQCALILYSKNIKLFK